jgi:DNA (cytosine-5)-methyltransferase 1
LNILSAPNVTTNGRNKYLTILDNAWQDHLKDRLPDAPTVISLFAGCGGSSLGYSMAGFRELLAVEWDDNAVATFKLNFPEVPVYHGDIVKLAVGQVFEMTGLKEGELDILDGSPPCQGFSTAGKRILEDDRNQLFREYVRLLRGLRPRVFVMENVSGMVKGKMKLIFAEIMRELKASGYKVSARLLNAMYFNVPQSRQRMIFVGVREDLGRVPSHPGAQGRPITIRKAWTEIPDEHGTAPKGQLAKLVAILPCGKGNGRGDYSYKAYGKRQFYGVKRLAWDETSPTIIKKWQRLFHPNHNAPPSIRQTKRLASFPDSYIFNGKESDQWQCIGNSVPPLFMKAISGHIKKEILEKVSL